MDKNKSAALSSDSTSELDQLVSAIGQLGRIISQSMTHDGEDKATTMLQLHLLHQLCEVESLTMSDIAQRCHLSLSSATQIIDRLVKDGSIERGVDEHDRRIVRIAITKAGRQLFEEMRQHRHQKLKEIFSHVPAADIKALIRIQTNLIHALEAKEEE